MNRERMPRRQFLVASAVGAGISGRAVGGFGRSGHTGFGSAEPSGASPAPRPAAANGLRADAGTHVLFLDMKEVKELDGVVQSVVEAKKHPTNPVLPLGKLNEFDSMRASPWAGRTVLYDNEEKLFKAWYSGMDFRGSEVVDPGTGQTVPGYGRRDCQHVDRDGVRLPVRWGGRTTLEGANPRSVAFRFWIYGDAKLYAFGFES